MTQATNKTFLIVCRKAPFGTSFAREALDVALAGSAFAQEVTLLFIDDGIFQLKLGQNGKAINLKGAHAALPALEMYDITRVYVDKHSLDERGLSDSDLAIDTKLLDSKQVTSLLQQSDIIFSF